MAAPPGVALDVDEVTARPPESPTYREGVSIWVWDDAGRFAFPRIGVEAVGATWTTSVESAFCSAQPDGRLLLVNGHAPPVPPEDASGRPRVLGAGPLRFECVEPFETWRVEFDGRVVTTTVADYLAGGVPKLGAGDGRPEAEVQLTIEARSIAPPWFQGTHEPEGHHVAGEARFEQLCTVRGRFVVDGRAEAFTGGGLRVHRKGGARNDYGDFHGHVWASAAFPSGRAFGFIHYLSGPDGVPRYREGWVGEADGRVVPATVGGTPWLDRLEGSGEELAFSLRSEGGEARIEATTFAASIRPPRPTTEGTTFPVLHSAIARFRWGGEEAFGMLERSARIPLPSPAADLAVD